MRETTFLGIVREYELIYIAKNEHLRNPIRFASHIGDPRPISFAMLGRFLMAYLTEADVNWLLE